MGCSIAANEPESISMATGNSPHHYLLHTLEYISLVIFFLPCFVDLVTNGSHFKCILFSGKIFLAISKVSLFS